MDINIITEKLKKLADRTIRKADNDIGLEMQTWQWFEGVALFGISKAYDILKDEAYLGFMKQFIDYHLNKKNFGKSINTTAPVLGAFKLLQITKDEKYYRICSEFADWCINEAVRCSMEGVYEHTCTANTYPNQVWADTLFMGCIFLAKWGVYTNNKIYSDEAVKQLYLHYKYLGDKETKLIYHGYYGNEGLQKGVLWGRGNGWFSVASSEIIAALGTGYPKIDNAVKNYICHCEGLAEFQTSPGGWRTVINHAETYTEMTATASFAYGIQKGINEGILGDEYKLNSQKAIENIILNINNDGELENASAGTCVMETVYEYNEIGFSYSHFAQGLAMLALSESLRAL